MVNNRLAFLVACCCLAFQTVAQPIYFPPLSGNEWDTLSPASLGWCEERIQFMYDLLEENHTKAFIVLKDGKIVLEKYFGTFVQDSFWYWASAGKSLTAFLVGVAQQEGFLSIEDLTSTYLGEGWTTCMPSQEEMITIRHQLSMSTGLEDLGQDPYCTSPDCLLCIADAGMRWAYHNAPYTLLDEVLESATGRNLNLYFQQKIRAFTGITGLYVQAGFNNIFFSNARSMARFGLLALNKAYWNDIPVLTDSIYFNQMVHSSQGLNLSYGFLWWLNGQASYMVPGLQIVFPGSLMPNAPEDMISALGKNGQYINVVPSMNMVVVRMGNAPENSDVPVVLNNLIWEHLSELDCGTSRTEESYENHGFFTIHPNPASVPFTILVQRGRYDVHIYDVSGREVIRYLNCIDSQEVLHPLAQGLYWVKVKTSENEVYSRKLVVQE